MAVLPATPPSAQSAVADRGSSGAPPPSIGAVGGPYAVETSGLTKRYPQERGIRAILRGRHNDKLALDAVDVRIRPGEIFGLLGPNGAGKTTLTKVLAGLLLPTEGKAYVAGLDVESQGHEIRTQIGLVHGDERTFFWRLSVYENLRFYATLYRMPAAQADRRIAELLDAVGLAANARTRMDRLSSGLKQRAAIARGLLNNPRILLMDEPTRMLDPLAALDVRQLIRQLVKSDRRRTVLLATNLLAEAEQLCDRVMLLNEGRVCLSGTMQEIRRTVQFEELHVLVVSGLGDDSLDAISRAPDVRSVRIRPLSGDRVEIELGTSHDSPALPQVIRGIVEAGGSVWSSTPREPSLQEVFHLAIRGENGRVPLPLRGGGA